MNSRVWYRLHLITPTQKMNEITETQKQVVKWLETGQVGSSSKCMAIWLAFGERAEPFAPSDPDDFDRCLKLLDKAPGLRPLLPRMAEVGLGWTKANSAPKTYALMRSILLEKGATHGFYAQQQKQTGR